MDVYEMKARKLESEVSLYHNNTKDWKSMKSQRNVDISYMTSPHHNGTLYKFECDVDIQDSVLFDVMKPATTSEARLSWDKSIKDYTCLKEISEDLRIGRIVTHSAAVGLIAMREFVDLYYFREMQPSTGKDYDRISWIYAETIEYAEHPVSKKFVRACNYPTGYAVARRASDPSKSRLILYVNCDIGGMVPKSLVDAALPSQQIAYIESVTKQARTVLAAKQCNSTRLHEAIFVSTNKTDNQPESMLKYEKTVKETEEEVLKYHDDVAGWTYMKTMKGVSIQYRKSPHFDGNLYRFECDIDAPDYIVHKVVKPPVDRDERLAWDTSVKDYKCLERVSEDLLIILVTSHSALHGLISSREFVNFVHFKSNLPSDHPDYDRISWVFAGKVDHPSRPVTKEFVRATDYPSGYAAARCRNDSSKTKLIMYFNCDLGGMLPRSLVESALPGGQIDYIERVKAQAKKLMPETGEKSS